MLLSLLALELSAASAAMVASLQAKVYGADTYAKCSGLYRKSNDKICTTTAILDSCSEELQTEARRRAVYIARGKAVTYSRT